MWILILGVADFRTQRHSFVSWRRSCSQPSHCLGTVMHSMTATTTAVRTIMVSQELLMLSLTSGCRADVRWQACEIADVDCKAMCDQADMTLAPPLAVPALMQAASACLTNASMTCSCPLQGGYFTLSSAGIMVPTHEVGAFRA